MKIMHLLTAGSVGGIEVLCRDIGLQSRLSHLFVFLFGEGLVYNDMKAKGMQVISLTQYKKISGARFRRLYEIAKEYDTIIVHHNDPFLESYYLLLQFRLPQKKYISMVHHCYDLQEDVEQYGVIKRMIKNLIVASMFKWSDRLIFVSKAGYQSYLQKFDIDDGKVAVIYNGIGEKKLTEGKSVQKKNKGQLIILYAGRLEKIKGVDMLIDAAAQLKHKDVRIIIVGDGKQRQRLEKQVRDHGLEAVIEFRGFQQNVNPWLEKADIFVYPSRSEIFGLSIVEAMAFQCICVANNVGGIPEIIEDERNGFLNTDNSIQGLTDTINRAIQICGDVSARKEMMRQARRTAERFDIQNTIHQLEKEVQ